MPRLLIDSRIDAENATRLRALATKHPEIEVVDTRDWNDQQRNAEYFERLLPLSVINQKRLRGLLRTHKAGNIFFHRGVLVLNQSFYVGNEIQAALTRPVEPSTGDPA